jgi:hypothetical protein
MTGQEPSPRHLGRPLVRLWNQVPAPIRKVLELLWRNRTARWLLVLLLILIFLPLVANLLGLGSSLLRIVGTGVSALLDNPVGRFLALLGLLIGITSYLVHRVRAERRQLLAARAADRYLSGLRHMVHRRFALARRDLQVVERTAREVDLTEAVPGFPELAQDAALKLAFCHAELGEIPQGMRCLVAVPRASLPGHLARAFDEVHALLYDRSPDFLAETKVVELERALRTDGRNPRLLRALVTRRREMGNLTGAIDVQRRLVDSLDREESSRERRHLAYLHYLRAREILDDDGIGVEVRRKRVQSELTRAIKADRDLPMPHLLRGDLHLEDGRPAEALAAWARGPSPPALERIATFLESSTRSPRELYPELVEALPTAGTLLLVARHAFARGEEPMAERILSRLAEEGISTPGQELLHGDVLAAQGRSEEADCRYLAGLEALLMREDA